MNFIEFADVSLNFGDNEILKNFSLLINEGEKVLISGKSGKGKSTLLRLLLGFENFDSGDIYIKENSITSSDFYETRKLFAYVNQDVTLRPGKVRDVLLEISKFSGNNYDGELNKELSNRFEFDLKLLDKDTEELSGGERQRLGIMLAIMLERPIFLLDEVTSSLDENLKKKVVEYFNTSDKTVIAISHDNVWVNSGEFRKVEW